MLSHAAARGLIGALQGEGGFGHRSQTWNMTAKIAASSSWPLLVPWGFPEGKEPGAVLMSKAETCKSALKPPNLHLRWEKQAKPPLQSP